jgi:hypothetical protein
MSFLNGRVTALRFKVDGPNPRLFTEEHLERLDNFRAGRQRIASADGVEVGWAAGDHILDTDFQPGKNIVNDALCFELRVDTDKLPSDLMKAYIEVELKALSKDNPSGYPSARQKKEARETAKERLEEEAKDGRFKKRKCIPVMWDAVSNEVLFGATSFTHIDRLVSLFQQTFGYSLDAMTAGKRAHSIADSIQTIDEAKTSAFIPGVSPSDVAWVVDDTSRDFLGNEFMLWLWFIADAVDDTVKASDGSEITFMLARKLALECPNGQTGTDGFAHEGPSRLPEAKRAIQSGKLPRKCGLTLVRHGDQYELTLHAETFAIGSAKLPPMPEDVTESRAMLETRVAQIRDLLDTVDHLYATFLGIRFGTTWTADVLPKMQRWLQSSVERKAAA